MFLECIQVEKEELQKRQLMSDVDDNKDLNSDQKNVVKSLLQRYDQVFVQANQARADDPDYPFPFHLKPSPS